MRHYMHVNAAGHCPEVHSTGLATLAISEKFVSPSCQTPLQELIWNVQRSFAMPFVDGTTLVRITPALVCDR